jgi:hypothetical protein
MFNLVKSAYGRKQAISGAKNPARILSDQARASTSPQTGDLHEVTGHHCYYGSSAAA